MTIQSNNRKSGKIYQAVYQSWLHDPEKFWMQTAEAVDWFRKPSQALFEQKAPFYSWFDDGQINTCWNAVDRHVENGLGEQPAIYYDSPVTGHKRTISYHQLQDEVAKIAGGMAARGVQPGDRVIIYMPMIPETIVAMLACARIGAIHSVVFGGFAAAELAVRISHCRPKAILSASCGIEPNRVVDYKPLLDQSIELADHKPDFCVIFQRDIQAATLDSRRDIDWEVFRGEAKDVPCLPLAGNHAAYILYTSGTTGAPKGIVRPTGGHIVALQWTMKNIYGLNPGDVFWTASDLGWVVGHSYICYAPLICGNPTVLYEGKPVGTPDASAFWRVISEYDVKALFTAPTAFRAIKRQDPDGALPRQFDLTGLRTLFLAGERADPDTIEWAERHLNVPVIDHWWQTETGWAIAGNPVGIECLPVKPGSITLPMPGYEISILDEKGQIMAPGELGTIAIKLPLPPGTLSTMWEADDRYQDGYLSQFPGYYVTGDAGIIDEDGYVYVMSRTDDVINVAGHRLSTGAFEEVLTRHPDIAECAVIGVKDELKGQLPMAFICLNSGSITPRQQIVTDVVSLVRQKIGPIAAFHLAVIVERLPKTRSGKILRSTMAKIADGHQFKVPPTIDDPAIIGEIKEALLLIGYPINDQN